MSKRKKREQPPIEERPVFVQFVRRQKCRYNPSFTRFSDLPEHIQLSVADRWHVKHPRENLDLLSEVSLPPVGRKRGDRG